MNQLTADMIEVVRLDAITGNEVDRSAEKLFEIICQLNEPQSADGDTGRFFDKPAGLGYDRPQNARVHTGKTTMKSGGNTSFVVRTGKFLNDFKGRLKSARACTISRAERYLP